MFTGFVTLLKLLWPFFKESMLEDGTLRDWFRRNRNTCIWIMFQLIILGVCFYLVEIITLQRQQDYQTTTELTKLQETHKSLQTKFTEQQISLSDERASNARMRVFLVERCKQYPEPCQFLIDETIKRQEQAGQPISEEQKTEARAMWCGVVRNEDLEDVKIRQRYLRECSVEKAADKPDPKVQQATS
jgi:hypothetical protein